MQDSVGALARRAIEGPELTARPIMRRGAAGMLRPFAARGAPTAASFGSYAARWTVRAVTPTHVPSGSVCARYRATCASFAQHRKCTSQIEIRAVLRCVRRGPSQVSAGDLDTYIGRSGRANSLLSELDLALRHGPSAVRELRDRGSSSDVRNVFQRDGMPHPISWKVWESGAAHHPITAWANATSRLTTTPRVDA